MPVQPPAVVVAASTPLLAAASIARMAQLNLRVSDREAAAIRSLAEREGVGISALVVRRVLGHLTVEPVRLDPGQIERLDGLEAVVAGALEQLASLDADVAALRASDPSDLIAGLERRLSALEELAARY